MRPTTSNQLSSGFRVVAPWLLIGSNVYLVLALLDVVVLSVLGVLAVAAWLPVALLWARLPGQVELKVLLLGGPVAWAYVATVAQPRAGWVAVLGGPVVLLVEDLRLS